jgi:hypothetical protein
MCFKNKRQPDYESQYVGKRFRYHSKYGGVVENILCVKVAVVERLDVIEGRVFIDDFELKIISDRNNVYDLKEVELYENND